MMPIFDDKYQDKTHEIQILLNLRDNKYITGKGK